MKKLIILAKRFYYYLQLRAAVIQADKAHTTTGMRYYVMPALDGRLIVFDRKNFRLLKQKHYISRQKKINDIERDCFYHTPCSNGSGAIFPRERKARAINYFIWKSRR